MMVEEQWLYTNRFFFSIMNIDPLSQTNDSVHLCAELTVEWKAEVEELLFFNPRQAVLAREILSTIRAFGIPRVVVRNGRLRIEIGNGLVLGTLYAQAVSEDGLELVGVLLFLRKGTGILCLHLSVGEAYSLRGAHALMCIAPCLLDGLRKIGTRIAGVDHIEIYYKQSGWRKIPLTVSLFNSHRRMCSEH